VSARSRDDEGFTLIEFLIYVSLMVVVVALVGAILITALGGQKNITDSSSGSTGGQLVTQNLSNTVRSATAIHVTVLSSTRELVQVATPGRGATPTPQCVAMYFTTEDGGAVFTRSSPTAIPAPTGSNPSGWTKLAGGLVKSARAGAPTTMLTANAALTTSVRYEFAIANGSGKPQLFASTITSRQNITASGSSSCA
jgi:Tfp pilus assembly protein PilV